MRQSLTFRSTCTLSLGSTVAFVFRIDGLLNPSARPFLFFCHYFLILVGKVSLGIDISIFHLNAPTVSWYVINWFCVTKSFTFVEWSIHNPRKSSIVLRSEDTRLRSSIIGGHDCSSFISVSLDNSKMEGDVFPHNILTLSFIRSMLSSPKNWYTSFINKWIGMNIGECSMSVWRWWNLYCR